MSVRLSIHALGSSRTFVSEDDSVLIGASKYAALRLVDPRVASLHAVLRRTPDGLEIADLASSTGTFVNGRRITDDARLKEGDEIQIGAARLVVGGGLHPEDAGEARRSWPRERPRATPQPEKIWVRCRHCHHQYDSSIAPDACPSCNRPSISRGQSVRGTFREKAEGLPERHADAIRLAVACADAGGSVDRSVARGIRTLFEERLGYTMRGLGGVRDAIKASSGIEMTDAEIAAMARRSWVRDALARRFVLVAMLEIACIDGTRNAARVAFAAKMSARLGFPPEELAHAALDVLPPLEAADPPKDEAATADPGAHDDWSILGVARGAGVDALLRAYRDQAQRYHPDRVAHLGAEFQTLAHERFVAIQAAFERLMKRRESR